MCVYIYMLGSTSLDIWRQADIVWYTSLVTAYLDWCSGAAPFPFRSSTTVQFMRSSLYIPRFQAEHGHTTVGSRCACGTSVTASVSAQNQCKTTNSEIVGSPACFLQEIYRLHSYAHSRVKANLVERFVWMCSGTVTLHLGDLLHLPPRQC